VVGRDGFPSFIMRIFLIVCFAVSLLPAVLLAQVVSVNSPSNPGFDARPFGKYLVQICTLSSDVPTTITCPPPPPERPGPLPPPPATYQGQQADQRQAQAITMKLVGCSPGETPCPTPAYPLAVGMNFIVSATADSGLPVTQTVVSGNVNPQSGAGTQQYSVNGMGTIVIKATVNASNQYAPAVPVELVLQVAEANDKSASGCPLFGPPAPTQVQPQIDLPSIITLVGNPTPFVLTAQGNSAIFIYSTRFPLRREENEILATIPSSIAALAGRTVASLGVSAAAKPFSVELSIPHAAALGDLATRISGLNYSQFTVQDIGTDRVRINASSQPDCPTWTAFLTAIRHLEWQVTPEPFELKLFYLSSTDAAAAFTALGTGSSAGSPASTAGGSTPTGGGAAPSAGATPASGGAASGTATIAVNQPPGSVLELKSDTTPCVVAGLTLSNTSGCSPASASGGGGSTPAASGGGGATPPASKPPLAMAAMAVAAGLGEQTPSDLLVFSDANPGDDAQIEERKRILATLDLPRPEMIINAWVMQNSTVNPRAMGMFAKTVRDLVAGYNNAIEDVVLRGWMAVKRETESPNYFNDQFYSYIADRYIADTYTKSTATDAQGAAQNFLDTSAAKLADPPDSLNRQYGVCTSGHYCLGYNSLFQPLKPRLLDFLLTLIAAADPLAVTDRAIRLVAGEPRPVTMESGCSGPEFGSRPIRELHERCRAIWTNLGLDRELSPEGSACASNDYRDILGSLLSPDPDSDPKHPRKRPHIYLNCFAEAADLYMPHAGLLRAAIADFLFHYKMSQQYPHEFSPYDLSHSADALNSALSPLIDGFNQDIVAFQTFMRADVQFQVDRLNSDSDQRCCVKRLFGLDKPSFFNDGLVTVRTISGQPTTVNTTSQSFLDSSTAPTLSNLLNSVANPGGGSANTGTSPLAGVLGAGAVPSAALAAGVLSAYQSSNVQIGRMLSLNVTPRSLSTASSAEIAVTLNTDETSGGPTYTGGTPGAAAQNTSRVANHDISTRIRVESVKLFEVSSFSAIVERSRSRFPLLPPFVEIPYIGTVAGIPIPGAKEYHNSTAVMSAMVVPTAADLAYGLQFVFDWVVDGDQGPSCSYVKGSAGSGVTNVCRFRRAVSIRDLNRSPVREFHRSMINCLATDMRSSIPSVGGLANTDTGACRDLSFDTVPNSN
jgi:hypothetical protein